jgi:hypothetical protein
MRPFNLIAAALLLACAAPAVGQADGMPASPGCHCLRPVHHVVRHVRYRRVRHVRRVRVVAAPVYAPPVYYNPLLPRTWDTDYDRAMVLHYRSPPVSGLYKPDPGYAPTPDVAGVQPYRLPANGTVYQFDGLIGQYVQLARWDAVRALPPAPPPPPPLPMVRPAPVAAAPMPPPIPLAALH